MKFLVAAVLLAATISSVRAAEYETGKLIAEVQCGHAQAQSYSYMLYLPTG